MIEKLLPKSFQKRISEPFVREERKVLSRSLNALALPKTTDVNAKFRQYGNDGSLITDGYYKNTVASSCISFYQRTYTEPSFLPYYNVGGEIADDTDEIYHLLDYPNLYMSGSQMQSLIVTYQLTTGACFIEILRESGSTPTGLFPYSALVIEPVFNSYGHLTGYEKNLGHGKKIPVAKEDIIYLPYITPDPINSFYAVSPLLLCARDLDTDVELTAFLYAHLRNNASPGTVLIPPSEMTSGIEVDEQTMESIISNFIQKTTGDGRGRVTGLQGGWDIKELGSHVVDLDLSNLRKDPEARICAAFGINPRLIGVSVGLDHSTDNNYEHSMLQYYQGTLSQLLKFNADNFSRAFEKEFEGKYYFEYDLDSIELIRQARIKQNEYLIGQFKDGIITKEELRTALGYEPLEEEVAPNELRSTVGGANAIKDLVVAYSTGQAERTSCVTLAKELYAFSEQTANALFPPLSVKTNDNTNQGS